MNKRKRYFLISLTLTVGVVFLLISGSPLLTLALDNRDSIPLGTFITWAGMISLPLSVYWGIKELRKPTTKFSMVLGFLLKAIIVLGILWVPISFLLAGNLAFTFSEKESFQGGQLAMIWFWRLSYGIAVGGIAILCTHFIALLFYRIRKG